MLGFPSIKARIPVRLDKGFSVKICVQSALHWLVVSVLQFSMDNSAVFDPTRVNLTDPDLDVAQVICTLQLGGNEYNGNFGARLSSIFVIFFVSTAVTFFPVLAKRKPSWRVPVGAYVFARYFGAGVIIATAFIHLLDPAYDEIGGNSCVGMTGHWADYSWCPALVLLAVTLIFLVDLGAKRYVINKYGYRTEQDIQAVITHSPDALPSDNNYVYDGPHKGNGVSSDNNGGNNNTSSIRQNEADTIEEGHSQSSIEKILYRQEIAAFLILEFGIIFHSVIIGLNLGVVGEEFFTLYPVLVFHQSFEGLGIGARMSAIPFAKNSWLPVILCLAYGLTTPISIAAGLGVRTTYEPESFTANVVSGVLDSLSAGILIYTGLVELLARDFLYDNSKRDSKQLTQMVIYTLLGMGVMALLGKWA